MLLVVCCDDDDVKQSYRSWVCLFLLLLLFGFGSLDLVALLIERRFFGLKISKCYDRKKGKNVQEKRKRKKKQNVFALCRI